MKKMKITLFGRFDVQIDGQTIGGFRSAKARALLAYLAVEANRPVPRARLATLLWGDYPEAQARKSLRNVLANLRRILVPDQSAPDQSAPGQDSSPLTIDRQTVLLTVDGSTCFADVARFDELMRSAPTVVSQSSRQSLLSEAVALYQADFLPGLADIDSAPFADWRTMQQESRHRQTLDALHWLTETAIDAATGVGDYTSATGYAHQQLQLEPWQERAHTQLMRILAAQGDRSAALAQFDILQRELESELGVHPSAEAQALYQAIRNGEGVAVQATAPVVSVQTDAPALRLSPSVMHKMSARLEPLPDQKLFGVERARAQVQSVLQSPDRPWLVALDGIGGIGKTTLANALLHDELNQMAERQSIYEEIAWISARQEEFRPGQGIAETGRPALTVESLTDGLLTQLLEYPPHSASLAEKRDALVALLKERPHLVVVDNLESVNDYESLIPFLRQLVNPTKFLITTRFSLQAYSDIFCYSLTELAEADALAFIQHEVAVRNIAQLADAEPAQLRPIYDVAGGNPLALKLVLAQIRYLSLAQVLENLTVARGKKVEQLYLYIYWQAWEMLDQNSRQLFLSMPIVPNGTFADLELASGLDLDELQEALTALIDLSLVQVGSHQDDQAGEPIYRLHRLTETFLMTEVLKWP